MNFIGIYEGMSAADALRKLNKQYIRKADCKDLLDKVASYLDNQLIAAKAVRDWPDYPYRGGIDPDTGAFDHGDEPTP